MTQYLCYHSVTTSASCCMLLRWAGAPDRAVKFWRQQSSVICGRTASLRRPLLYTVLYLSQTESQVAGALGRSAKYLYRYIIISSPAIRQGSCIALYIYCIYILLVDENPHRLQRGVPIPPVPTIGPVAELPGPSATERKLRHFRARSQIDKKLARAHPRFLHLLRARHISRAMSS